MNCHVLLRGFSFLVGHERSHFTLPVSADVDGRDYAAVMVAGQPALSFVAYGFFDSQAGVWA